MIELKMFGGMLETYIDGTLFSSVPLGTLSVHAIERATNESTYHADARDELDNELTKLRSNVDDLEIEIEDFKSERKNLEVEIENLEDKRSDLEDEIDELQSTLELQMNTLQETLANIKQFVV